MIGFAIFGAGRMGQRYIELLCQVYKPAGLAEVIFVIEVDRSFETKLEKFSITPTQLLTFDNYLEALEDERVNAVIITSPSSEHEKQIIQSLKRGKHVYCEKPISIDTLTVSSCFDLALESKRLLFCAMQRKHDPQYRRVFNASRSAEFGRAVLVKSCSRDYYTPPVEYMRQSGGIICDSAVHDIHLCCWFIGAHPVSVYAVGSANGPEAKAANDLDIVSITIKFANGAIAIIDISRRASYGYDQRLEILSENGRCLKVDNMPLSYNQETKSDPSELPRLKFDTCTDRYREAYRAELDYFIARLSPAAENVEEFTRQEKESTVTVCKVVDAAKRSIVSGNAEQSSID